MTVLMNRIAIINKLITLMRDAIPANYEYLAKLNKQNIMFKSKNPYDAKVFIDEREIWVFPAEDRVRTETTIKFQHVFKVIILFAYKSMKKGITNSEEVVGTIEDIENLLLANLTLPDNNGTIRFYEGDGFDIDFDTVHTPIRTLNLGSIEFSIDKSTML